MIELIAVVVLTVILSLFLAEIFGGDEDNDEWKGLK